MLSRFIKKAQTLHERDLECTTCVTRTGMVIATVVPMIQTQGTAEGEREVANNNQYKVEDDREESNEEIEEPVVTCSGRPSKPAQ